MRVSQVEVEVLDVTDEEARALLLSIDPLAQTQEQLHTRLLEFTPTDNTELEAAWRTAAETALADGGPKRHFDAIPEQFLIVLTCRDEKHRVELLERFREEGLACKALLS